MRMIIAAVMFAAVVSATCVAPTGLYYAPGGNCPEWRTCVHAFCTTMGNTSIGAANATNTSLNPLHCVVGTSKTCAETTAAVATAFTCLVTAANQGKCQDMSDGFGELSMALIGDSAAEWTAGTSTVKRECERTSCAILAAAGQPTSCTYSSCAFAGSNTTNTTAATTAPSNATSAPSGSATTTAPTGTSAAPSVSTAVLAVLATIALLL